MDDATRREVVEQTADYVRGLFQHDSSGHDWWHIDRVWKTAIALAEREGADRYVVELAALLHDVDDWKLRPDGAVEGPAQARAWLQHLGVEPTVIEHVCEIAEHVSFKGASVATPMRTREGMVVQDADRLDAIGAIGIARAFAYGGHKGRLLHDPQAQPQLHASFEAYQANQGTTINHFYEKLLLLQDRMNTETARAIARHRTEYMRTFLDEFFREWEAQDAAAGNGDE
jgi:uncharacterized protein